MLKSVCRHCKHTAVYWYWQVLCILKYPIQPAGWFSSIGAVNRLFPASQTDLFDNYILKLKMLFMKNIIGTAVRNCGWSERGWWREFPVWRLMNWWTCNPDEIFNYYMLLCLSGVSSLLFDLLGVCLSRLYFYTGIAKPSVHLQLLFLSAIVTASACGYWLLTTKRLLKIKPKIRDAWKSLVFHRRLK